MVLNRPDVRVRKCAAWWVEWFETLLKGFFDEPFSKGLKMAKMTSKCHSEIYGSEGQT